MPLAFVFRSVAWVHMADYGEELTLEELWSMLRPALLPALALAFAVSLLTYFLTDRSPRVYRATAKVLVVEGGGRSFADPLYRIPSLDPDAYREVAKSRSLLEPLGLHPEEKGLRVQVIQGRRSSVLVLSVEDTDPRRAAERANAWAKALVAWEDARARAHFEQAASSLQARLEVVDRELADARAVGDTNRVGALERLKADLLRDLDMVRALRISVRGNLQVLENARPPDRPVAPRPKLAAVLAGTLGFFLLVFGVLLRQALDPRIRSSEEAARIVGLPVLGEFPRVPPGVGRRLSQEAANYLRANLDQALSGVSPKVLVVTGAEAGAGKSSVALALARAYARTARPVLLVDADLRRPVLDEELKVEGEPGLVGLLREPAQPLEPHRVQPFLDFLPAGGTPETPSELLTEHWKGFIARVLDLERYEVVIIDSAPLLPVADTLVIVPHASGTLLVAAVGATYKRHLVAAHDLLKRVGAKVLGLALTRVRETAWFLGGYRGYRYGYGYGYSGRPRRPSTLEEEPRA